AAHVRGAHTDPAAGCARRTGRGELVEGPRPGAGRAGDVAAGVGARLYARRGRGADRGRPVDPAGA
ncbi:MAG: hypothetical protein AVDCRST_MAG54-2919, partial [uncultured Actinomycetospora sp.]